MADFNGMLGQHYQQTAAWKQLLSWLDTVQAMVQANRQAEAQAESNDAPCDATQSIKKIQGKTLGLIDAFVRDMSAPASGSLAPDEHVGHGQLVTRVPIAQGQAWLADLEAMHGQLLLLAHQGVFKPRLVKKHVRQLQRLADTLMDKVHDPADAGEPGGAEATFDHAPQQPTARPRLFAVSRLFNQIAPTKTASFDAVMDEAVPEALAQSFEDVDGDENETPVRASPTTRIVMRRPPKPLRTRSHLPHHEDPAKVRVVRLRKKSPDE